MQLPNKKFILHPISILAQHLNWVFLEQIRMARQIKSDAELFLWAIYDFWFEYKTVVPKVSSVFWVN
jgi:hypothetical protein